MKLVKHNDEILVTDNGEQRPRVRRTQAQRVAESDQRIFDAATRLIAMQGYSSTTLEQIGATAGYSRQLVTQRFGSKDKLLQAVISRHVTMFQQQFDAQVTDGLAGLYWQIDTYLRALEDPAIDSRAFFVLMLESVGPAPQFRHVFAEITRLWEAGIAKQIEAGQRQGTLRADIDPALEARLFIATLRGLRIQSLINPHDEMDVAVTFNGLKLMLAERLLPRATPSLI